MIPASVLTQLATLGLSEHQVSAVASMLAKVEEATEQKVGAELEARRASDRARTAIYRQRGGGDIPADLRQAVFERDGFRCVYCDSENHLQCDHVIPVSRDGETSLENLATACRVCNARKRDRDRKFVQRHSADKADKTGHPRTAKAENSSRARVLHWEDSSITPPDDPNGSSTPKGVGVPKKSGSQNRGTRLPDGWQPKSEHLELALSLALGRDRYERAADEFRDYWRAVPGTRGTKLDWDATFRNRLRDIAQREVRPQARAGPLASAGNLSTLMQKMRNQQNGEQSPSEPKDITPTVSEPGAGDPGSPLSEPHGKPSGGGEILHLRPASPDARRSPAPHSEAARTFEWPNPEWERG